MKSPHLGGPHLELGEEDPNDAFRRLISWSFAVAPLFGRNEGGRIGYANEGAVKGDVKFAPDDLPTFAQPETQSVTRALDIANAALKIGRAHV